MEIKTQYKMLNGDTTEDFISAILGDEIVNTKIEIKNLQQKLKELESKCNCADLKKIGTPSQKVRTVQNSFGDDCGEIYTVQDYRCKVCRRDWYYHVEEGELYRW